MNTSFVLPICEYGDVMMTYLSKRQIHRIEIVHKTAGRMVSGTPRGTPLGVVYHELGWESSVKRREGHTIL